MKKVYISGPISGRPKEEVENQFRKAAERIQAAGDTPVLPIDNDIPRDATWEEHMRTDIKMLLDCDEVYALHGWDRSQGAALEVNIAVKLHMNVTFEP